MATQEVTHVHSFVPYDGPGFDLNGGRTELTPVADSQRDACSTGWDIKVVVVGEAGVGKTSLLKRASHDEFDSNYKVTIGVDFEFLKYDVFGIPLTLTCWDTAGQEKYAAIARTYYSGAEAAIIVYDGHDPESFKKVTSRWLPELKRSVDADIPIFLVCNKMDLVCFVEDTEVAALSRQHKLETYRASVKDDALLTKSHSRTPARNLFNRIACVMAEKLLSREAAPVAMPQAGKKPPTSGSATIRLDGEKKQNGKNTKLPGCCK